MKSYTNFKDITELHKHGEVESYLKKACWLWAVHYKWEQRLQGGHQQGSVLWFQTGTDSHLLSWCVTWPWWSTHLCTGNKERHLEFSCSIIFIGSKFFHCLMVGQCQSVSLSLPPSSSLLSLSPLFPTLLLLSQPRFPLSSSSGVHCTQENAGSAWGAEPETLP